MKYILVLQKLYWYFGAHTGNSDLIRVLQNLYMYFKSHTCVTELILILRNLYWSYGHILILRILSLCEGTRRYDKSELIIIVSHTRSDQTYADTYQVWTLVHSRYRS